MFKITAAALLLSLTSLSLADSNRFLAISDIHYNHTLNATTYGKDTGKQLWQATQDVLTRKMTADQPDFVLVLGDLPGHATSVEERKINIRTILQGLRKTVGQEKPVFFLPGNNDSIGGDHHSFTDADNQTPLNLDPAHGWPALNVKPSCKNTTAPCMIETPYHLRYGFYQAYIKPHLRLIALNTVIFGNSPKHPYTADDGASQAEATLLQLHWFKSALADAEKAGDSVYIAMHVPPGADAWQSNSDRQVNMWVDQQIDNQTNLTQAFLNDIDEHKSIIRGVFYGHTHYDALRKLYNQQGDVTTIAYSIPGDTPQHYNNPGFKIFEYSPQDFTLLDSQTYYTEPGNAHWLNKQYDFKEDASCTLGTMAACVNEMSVDALSAVVKKEYLLRNNASKNWPEVAKAIHVKY